MSSVTASASLPIPLTTLIGREREIDEIVTLLHGGTRLVTLTGPGGVGKTRVAIAVAHRLVADYPDGVWFVDLAPLTNPDVVMLTIAATLGVRITGQQFVVDALVMALRQSTCLLVIDNVEQVVDAAASLTTLLHACPLLVMLATSRVPLHVQGEQQVEIAPLTLPDASALVDVDAIRQSDAVALFEARARLSKSDFHITHANASTVATICQRLDGLPLAIELAAARIRLLPPPALLARLDARLPLLTAGARDAPTRQQTLRDAIAWSYDLLSPHDQRLFRALSVFRGGWMLEAAEVVAGHGGDEGSTDTLADLDVLVGHSLVRAVEQPDGSMRYTMLETIREYGVERLLQRGEQLDASRCHADYFLTFMQQMDMDNLAGDIPRQQRLMRIDADHDNLRAALRWLFDTNQSADALTMTAALASFWSFRSHLSEGRRWLHEALDGGLEAPLELYARALEKAALLAGEQSDFDAVEALSHQSLAIYRRLHDRRGTADSLASLASIAYHQGDRHQAAETLSEALELYRALGDTRAIANQLYNLGTIAIDFGHFGDARRLFTEGLTFYERFDDVIGTRKGVSAIGWVDLEEGDLAAAEQRFETSLTIARHINDHIAIAESLYYLGHVSLMQGMIERAYGFSMDAMQLHRERHDSWALANDCEQVAGIAVAIQEYTCAACLLATAHALRERLGVVPQSFDGARAERWLHIVKASLAREAFDAAWKIGASMTIDAAFSYAKHLQSLLITPVTPATDPHVDNRISKRETDVLRLLVDGKSNQEIAEALFISPHTVANHVANIMNKLGVDSRTAAATWAVRNSTMLP